MHKGTWITSSEKMATFAISSEAAVSHCKRPHSFANHREDRHYADQCSFGHRRAIEHVRMIKILCWRLLGQPISCHSLSWFRLGKRALLDQFGGSHPDWLVEIAIPASILFSDRTFLYW